MASLVCVSKAFFLVYVEISLPQPVISATREVDVEGIVTLLNHGLETKTLSLDACADKRLLPRRVSIDLALM